MNASVDRRKDSADVKAAFRPYRHDDEEAAEAEHCDACAGFSYS
jgi:hypothetical protein